MLQQAQLFSCRGTFALLVYGFVATVAVFVAAVAVGVWGGCGRTRFGLGSDLEEDVRWGKMIISHKKAL